MEKGHYKPSKKLSTNSNAMTKKNSKTKKKNEVFCFPSNLLEDLFFGKKSKEYVIIPYELNLFDEIGSGTTCKSEYDLVWPKIVISNKSI